MQALVTQNTDGEYAGIRPGYKPVNEAEPYPNFANLSHPVISKLVGTYQVPIPTWSITAAEACFLRAEAALLGFGGNANGLYKQGIQAHMNQFDVNPAAAAAFIATPAGTLSGSTAQQLGPGA